MSFNFKLLSLLEKLWSFSSTNLRTISIFAGRRSIDFLEKTIESFKDETFPFINFTHNTFSNRFIITLDYNLKTAKGRSFFLILWNTLNLLPQWTRIKSKVMFVTLLDDKGKTFYLHQNAFINEESNFTKY